MALLNLNTNLSFMTKRTLKCIVVAYSKKHYFQFLDYSCFDPDKSLITYSIVNGFMVFPFSRRNIIKSRIDQKIGATQQTATLL